MTPPRQQRTDEGVVASRHEPRRAPDTLCDLTKDKDAGTDGRSAEDGARHTPLRRNLLVGLCVLLVFATVLIAAGLGVSLARLNGMSSDADDLGRSSHAREGKAGGSQRPNAAGSVADTQDGGQVMQKLQLRQLKVMRVGRRLESVMSHWLDAKAILGSKYTTAEVSIDSAPGPPDALTGNDPPRYPHIGVVMDGNGELVVAVQSASNDGFHLGVFHAEGRFWDASGWEAVDISIQDGPALTSPDGHSLMVFFRGADNNIWYNTRHDIWWGAWHVIEGANATSALAVVSHFEVVHLFARSVAGTVMHGRSGNKGITWEWQDLGGTLKERSSPAAAVSPDGRFINVAIRGRDNAIWHLRLADGMVDVPWRRIPSLGAVTSSPSLAHYNNELQIVVRGEDRTTFWEDVSTDSGRTFAGAWRSWNQGFESSPAAASFPLQPSRLAILGVSQRGELSVLKRSEELPTAQWASLGPLPRRDDDRDAQAVEAAPTDAPEEEPSTDPGSCLPCEACQFYEHACWGACSFSCKAEADCSIDTMDASLQSAAALRSCSFLWAACGNQLRLRMANTAPSPNQTSHSPDKLRSTAEPACQAKLQDFCTTTIWRENLYQMTSPSYSESCGEIIFSGTDKCSTGYAYSLYRALVPDSCDTAVLEFSQLSTGGAGGGAIPPPGSPEAGLPWQQPR
mmetsp:Transcript_23454/g.60156  ORF Transcript_23454/g.60156 Transcript_23454/m.60156 type:complete len:681 (-) Transcript_23454:119-2161(-)